MPLSSIVYAINGQIINEQTGAAIPNIAIGGTTSNQDGYFSYSYTPTLGKTGEIVVNIKTNGYLPYEKIIAVDKIPKQLLIELQPQVSNITLSAFDFPVPPMIIVPGGTFTMGCTPEQEYVCQLHERPAHQVKLDSFEIGKYEVTNEEFAAFLNDYGSHTIKTGAYVGKALVKADLWGVKLSADGTWQPVEGYSTHPAIGCLLYTSPSPRDQRGSRMPSSA